MNRKNIIREFQRYSSKSHKELLPLVDEYISSGRRRKIILKIIFILSVMSFAIGPFERLLKSAFNMSGGSFFSGIVGGLLITLSVFAGSAIMRKDIQGFMKSKEIKTF